MKRFFILIEIGLMLIASSLGAEVIQYRYDGAARIGSVDYGNGAVQTYVYDLNGNVERREMSTSGGSDNDAPSAPVLLTPAEGSTVPRPVRLEWVASTDPNGDPISYRVYCALDGTPLDATSPRVLSRLVVPVQVLPFEGSLSIRYGALLLASLSGFFLLRRRRGVLGLLLVVLLVGVTACGGGGGSTAVSSIELRTLDLDDLEAGKSYQWKVAAVDGNGLSSDSVTWRFTTQ